MTSPALYRAGDSNLAQNFEVMVHFTEGPSPFACLPPVWRIPPHHRLSGEELASSTVHRGACRQTWGRSLRRQSARAAGCEADMEELIRCQGQVSFSAARQVTKKAVRRARSGFSKALILKRSCGRILCCLRYCFSSSAVASWIEQRVCAY